MVKCKFEHGGYCCNCGAMQYMDKCEKPCDTIEPITNADRIRSMSDEGIAKYFAEILVEQRVLDAAANGKNISYVSRRVLEAAFYSMLLQQLKQPAKDGEDDA